MMIKFWFFFNDVIFSDFKDDIFESSLIVDLSFFFFAFHANALQLPFFFFHYS